MQGNKAVTVYRRPGIVRGATWSKQERMIVFWNHNGTVLVWDVDGERSLTTYQYPHVVGATWSRDEKLILSWDDYSWSTEGTVQFWDIGRQHTLTTFKLVGGVKGATWSQDQKRILSWSGDGTVQVWDVGANQALPTYTHPARSRERGGARMRSAFSPRVATCRSGRWTGRRHSPPSKTQVGYRARGGAGMRNASSPGVMMTACRFGTWRGIRRSFCSSFRAR
jgi:hypothetical protein